MRSDEFLDMVPEMLWAARMTDLRATLRVTQRSGPGSISEGAPLDGCASLYY